VARRNGFTLIETLIVLVVIGLVGLIAMPKFQQALAQSNILSAKAKLMALYAKARATAAGSSVSRVSLPV
jgi:prepilin-type N-terminal cleavage/methylation domain-containing protein